METGIAEYSQTEAALQTLRQQYKNTIFKVETLQGLQLAKVARREIRTYRTSLEAMRKEIKAPALDRCRLIDSEAKRIQEALLSLEAPIDEQIKTEERRKEEERRAKEEADRERIAKIELRISRFSEFTGRAAGATLMEQEQLHSQLSDLAQTITEDTFAEFLDRAHAVHASSLSVIQRMVEKNREREELLKVARKAEAAAQIEARRIQDEARQAKKEAQEREQVARAIAKEEADKAQRKAEEQAKIAQEAAEEETRKAREERDAALEREQRAIEEKNRSEAAQRDLLPEVPNEDPPETEIAKSEPKEIAGKTPSLLDEELMGLLSHAVERWNAAYGVGSVPLDRRIVQLGFSSSFQELKRVIGHIEKFLQDTTNVT